MKKILFFLLAFFASFNLVQAQSNVTSGKTVVPLGGLKEYTKDDNVTKYTISNDDLQKITKDGNTDNVFLFPEGGYDTDANKTTGIQGFYIDLGSSTKITKIHTTWEGAAASYKVYLSDSEPTTENPGTQIAEYTSAGQETVKNVDVTSETTGRYITFVPQEATNYGWGVKIRTFVAYDNAAAELGSIVVSPVLAEAGSTQTFTVKAFSTAGIEIPSGVTYTFDSESSTLDNVNVTEGEHTIVATYDGKTAFAKVYGVNVPAAPEESEIQAKLYGNDGTTTNGTTSFINYDLGTSGVAPTEIALGSSKVKYAQNAGKLFFHNSELTAALNSTFTNKADDGKNYKTLSLDLWSADAQSGNIVIIEDGSEKSHPVTLEAATWKTIQISIEDVATVGNISIRLDKKGDAYPDFAVANIYMLNKTVEANPFNISVADGVATVTGNVSSDNVYAINNADAIMINMTGVNEIKDAITINPKNPNALVWVTGKDDNGYKADEKYNNLTAKNKVVVDTWVYPVAQLEFTDGVGAKFWNGEGTTINFISTKTNGYKITCKLTASTYYTTCLPNNVSATDGIEVYEFTEYNESESKIKFTKKADGNINKNTPYLLKATKDVELVVVGTDDLGLNDINGSKTVGNLTFKGNGVSFKPESNSFVGLTIEGKFAPLSTSATVGAFRAYFDFSSTTTPDADAAAAHYSLIFDDGETTGIDNIDGTQIDGTFYNLQGQKVNNPKKGLYIINGKKVIVK